MEKNKSKAAKDVSWHSSFPVDHLTSQIRFGSD